MTKPQYTSTIESPSETTRTLKVQVPQAQLDSIVETKLIEAQRTVELKGFRKGHVPMNIVKQHFESSVRRDALSDVIDLCFRHALADHLVHPVGQPELTVTKASPDIEFSVQFEVMPKVTAKNYSGLPLVKEVRPVTDEDVQGIIQHFLDNQAELIPVEGRSVATGDFVDFSYEGELVKSDGSVEKNDLKGSRLVEVGKGELIGGFEDALIGLDVDGTKSFETTYPKGFGNLSEKAVVFTVKVLGIKLKRLPELTDDFAKSAGFESLLDLRVKARQSIESERETQALRKLEQEMISKLIEKNPFSVPQSLVLEEKELLEKEWAEMLKKQNATQEIIDQAIKKEDAVLRERAEQQVRAALILSSIAEIENISVQPEDIDAEYQNQALSMRMKVDEIRKHYDSNPRYKSNLAYRLRERKTIEFLVKRSKVTDKTI